MLALSLSRQRIIAIVGYLLVVCCSIFVSAAKKNPYLAGTDDGPTQSTGETLVFGMGLGTFIVFFFFLLLSAIWFFTSLCSTTEKIIWRGVSTLIFVIILLILIFSERETQANIGSQRKVYDYAVIPRIAIALVLCVFAIVSVIQLVEHAGESREVSNTEREYSMLWVK